MMLPPSCLPAVSCTRTHALLSPTLDPLVHVCVTAGRIAYVEPDYPLFITALPSECRPGAARCTDDQNYYAHFVQTNTDQMWASLPTFGGRTRTGAVIDTGTQLDHVELDAVMDVAGSIGCDAGNCNTNPWDENGHGVEQRAAPRHVWRTLFRVLVLGFRVLVLGFRV
jgi:hypothetical protein